MRDDDPRHGSTSGFHAHRRAGQEPCEPCRAADREYQRLYRLGYRRIDSRTWSEHVEADDALTGGRWVNVRGVMRWHPDTVTA